MKKRGVALLMAAVFAVANLSGCGRNAGGDGTLGEKEKVRLMVWSPSEDQSKESGEWLQSTCEKFAEEHPEWDITFVYGVADEATAASQVAQDPEESADVFMYANDTLTTMTDAKALAKFGGKYREEIENTNSEEVLSSLIKDGDLYGVPFTTNTWFMYYDKSVFSEEDIKNLDSMLEKGTVAFPLTVSYCLSRLKFKLRKPYMNMAMILGLFPGFMSMIAVYFILKAIGLTEGNLIRVALILCYSGGAGLGFQIAKGFFDTIPYAVDEAAILDGCTRWQVFQKITLPLSKPIIVYTVLTAFMGPWLDFIFAKVICRANSDQYTVAIGLWKMLEKEYIDSWYTSFAAGAVLISIPIAILFLIMQRYYVDGVSGAVKG